MVANDPEFKSLTERLEKLEKQNSNLKRSWLAALTLLGAFVALGQAPANRTIAVDEFQPKDHAGVVRAKLGFVRDEPALILYDQNERKRAYLMPDALGFVDSDGTRRVMLGSDTAVMYDAATNKIVGQGPGLMMFGTETTIDLRAIASNASLSIRRKGGNSNGTAVLEYSEDAPSLRLVDAQGFRAIVGRASFGEPSTGVTSKSSAASVILFDKDGKSVWSAP
jgi:hypothetical protein